MLEPNFPSVEPRGPHLQLISGWWFSGCSVWWGSAALDHHSIQLCVYLSFSNKSLPVPVCLAPQTHNLLPRSALLASPLLLPRCDPLLFTVQWGPSSSRATDRAVFPEQMRKISRARLIGHKLESDHSYRSSFSLCPLGLNTCWLGKHIFISGSPRLQAFGWQMISLSTTHPSGRWMQLILLLDIMHTPESKVLFLNSGKLAQLQLKTIVKFTDIYISENVPSLIHWLTFHAKIEKVDNSYLYIL